MLNLEISIHIFEYREVLMKLFEKIKIGKEWEISIFNLVICQYEIKEEGKKEYNYLHILPPQRLREKFFDELLENIGNQYSDYFIFRGGSGDFYLMRFFVKSLISKIKAQNPVFITKKENLIKLAQLIGFPYPIIYYNFDLAKSNIFENAIYKDKRFIAFHSKSFVSQLYQDAKIGKINKFKDTLYPIESCENVNIERYVRNNTSLNLYDIDCKLKKLKLNIDKFILLVPHSISCKQLDDVFWRNLQQKLKEKGFDVLVNSDTATWADKKYLFSYEELFILLQKRAKGVIGLRCGLFDIISWINIPMHIIYSGSYLLDLPASVFMKIHTLTDMPNSREDCIKQYIAGEDLDQLLHSILSNI